MARSYRPVVRDQEFLLPPNMAEWLPADHLVWFVIEVVEQLDTSAFHAKRRLGAQGRRGYDPDMLLGLLLYAYAVGERSSRRIERLCVDHVAFRVVCAQDGPDHSTIARFRAEHEAAFADLFTQVLRLCAAAGMVKVGVVAIDGTKIAANAARGANRRHDSVRDEARRIAEEMIAQAEVDQTEDAQAAAQAESDGENTSGDGLPAGFANHSRRAAAIAKALAEIERQDAEHVAEDEDDAKRVADYLARLEAGEPVIGRLPAGVDPVRVHQARIRRFEQIITELEGVRGVVAGKTVSHLRREAKRKLKDARRRLEAAEDAAAAGTLDRRGRAQRRRAMREQAARSRGGLGEAVNLTDPDSRLMTQGAGGGSVQGYNAQFAVTDDHLVLGVHLSQDANDTGCYTPTLDVALAANAVIANTRPSASDPSANGHSATIGTVLADAGYFTEDNLNAEGPKRLIAPGKSRDLPRDAAAKVEPDTNPEDPPADAGPLELMRHRLKQPDAAELYKRRSATVEPVFGHLKDRIGLRRFSRRGLTAVTAELHLAATVLNLNRLHTAT